MTFCFHDWGNWSKPFDTMSDCEKLQYRYCTKCNKCHVKKIKQPWNSWFGAKALEESSQP